jgi:hypothetical protein
MTLAGLDVVSNLGNAPMVPRAGCIDSWLDWPGIRPPAVDVLEACDLKELEPYAADWNKLLPATPGASYFHAYDWFAAYWRHFGQGQRMRVLLVLDDGRLVGVVPLVVTRTHKARPPALAALSTARLGKLLRSHRRGFAVPSSRCA